VSKLNLSYANKHLHLLASERNEVGNENQDKHIYSKSHKHPQYHQYKDNQIYSLYYLAICR
jgi:hypothetical protein